LGVVVGLILAAVGSIYYSGLIGVYIGISEELTFTYSVPSEIWYLLGGLAASLIIFAGASLDPEIGWMILSVMVGGLIMVTGYFLYELFLVGLGTFAEIPVNIGQMSVGLVVSIPVVRAVWRYLPTIRGR